MITTMKTTGAEGTGICMTTGGEAEDGHNEAAEEGNTEMECS